MELINVLSGAPTISFYGEAFEVSLGWLGNLIRLLTVGVGSVGVGIVLFSLILKAITLPFDIYQRVAMRKQNQKMKENQAYMEKLQKQYANDKQAYNQKVMEMYKANGISMFSSCLPMILSLVIFFVAMNAFQAFSRAANIENYNTMVDAYSGSIQRYCPDLEQGKDESDAAYVARIDEIVTVADKHLEIREDGKYIYYKVTAPEEVATLSAKDKVYYIENAKYSEKSYYVDKELIKADAEKGEAVAPKAVAIMAFVNARGEGVEENVAFEQYFENEAQQAVYEAYHAEDGVLDNTSFLWIKNIWATDASYKSPVLEFDSFEAEIGAVGGGCGCGSCSSSEVNFLVGDNEYGIADMGAYTGVYSQEAYNKITGKLTQEKEQANGFYVLIVLSVGTILLQQFITMRSQKEQQKYSSVDGQGGSQQKMTMIIMTGMFAIFAFIQSSAFSIYMIMSNVISLFSTILINKLVDVKLAKKEAAAMQAKYDKRLPRVTQNDKKKKK